MESYQWVPGPTRELRTERRPDVRRSFGGCHFANKQIPQHPRDRKRPAVSNLVALRRVRKEPRWEGMRKFEFEA